MAFMLSTFRVVSMIFAVSAVATGLQAIVDPAGFSRVFGLPLLAAKVVGKTPPAPGLVDRDSNASLSYISLMGARQLATGILLLTFAYQKKWSEIATVLGIIGFVVAGTDGFYLARAGNRTQAKWHAIPGALIAVFAIAMNLTGI